MISAKSHMAETFALVLTGMVSPFRKEHGYLNHWRVSWEGNHKRDSVFCGRLFHTILVFNFHKNKEVQMKGLFAAALLIIAGAAVSGLVVGSPEMASMDPFCAS